VGKVLHVGEKTGRDDIAVGETVWVGGFHAKLINQVPIVVQPLPSGIDLAAATFIHLAAIGLHCLNRAQSRAGEVLYVVGQGFLGQLTAQVGRILGMTVVVSEVAPFRLEMSRKHSCKRCYSVDDGNLTKELAALGGADVIVNSTGAADMEDALIALLNRGGRLVAQGMTPTVSFRLYPALGKEVSVVISADSTRDEDKQCIQFLAEGKLNIAPLITHRVSPQEAVNLYAKRAGADVLGTVIDWRGV